jgi:hypothetical protein
MKRFITLIIILPIILFPACMSPSGPWGKNKFTDTLSVHSVPFEVLRDKQMDSAVQFCDVNFDGFNDVAIIYSSLRSDFLPRITQINTDEYIDFIFSIQRIC